MDFLQTIITILSLLVAALAWVAKLRWSDEFAKAKDETIKSKEALIAVKDAHIQRLESEISGYQELNPVKIKEYYQSVKSQFEEIISSLQKQIVDLKEEISNRDGQIAQLTNLGAQKEDERLKAISERDDLINKVTVLEDEIARYKPAYDEILVASGSATSLSERYDDVFSEVEVFQQRSGRVSRIMGNTITISSQSRDRETEKQPRSRVRNTPSSVSSEEVDKRD